MGLGDRGGDFVPGRFSVCGRLDDISFWCAVARRCPRCTQPCFARPPGSPGKRCAPNFIPAPTPGWSESALPVGTRPKSSVKSSILVSDSPICLFALLRYFRERLFSLSPWANSAGGRNNYTQIRFVVKKLRPGRFKKPSRSFLKEKFSTANSGSR